jgi:hypothetical protein
MAGQSSGWHKRSMAIRPRYVVASKVSDGELEVLYREEATRLWRAVLAFTMDRAVAEDAVAEASPSSREREEASASHRRGSGVRRSASRRGRCNGVPSSNR